MSIEPSSDKPEERPKKSAESTPEAAIVEKDDQKKALELDQQKRDNADTPSMGYEAETGFKASKLMMVDSADSASMQEMEALKNPKIQEELKMRRSIRSTMEPGPERDEAERITKEVFRADHIVEPIEYTVKKGDNLWRIARKHLGKEVSNQAVQKHVQEIVNANNIKNPDLIHPGQVFALPGNAIHGEILPSAPEPKPEQKEDQKEEAKPAPIGDEKGEQPEPKIDKGEPGPEPENKEKLPQHEKKEDSKQELEKRDEPIPELEERGKQNLEQPEKDEVKEVIDEPKEKEEVVEKTESEKEKDKLLELAEERGLDKIKVSELLTNFEDRQKKYPHLIEKSEIPKTLHQVSRLLESEAKEPLDQKTRAKIAEQVLFLAAKPNYVDQGDHNTCNVATVEERIYFRTPSDAAKLVADVALTGEYTNRTGIKVALSPKSTDPESLHGNFESNDRIYASELFEVTAVNLRLAKKNAETDSKLSYSRIDGKEALRDYSGKEPKIIDDSPNLKDCEIAEIIELVTGKPETKALLGNQSNFWGRKEIATTFNTEQEFLDKLIDLRNKNQFPVILKVNTGIEPFHTDSGYGTAGGSGGYHVVTLHELKLGPPPTIGVDNQWGEGSDHLSKDTRMEIHELFRTTQTLKDARDTFQKEFDEAKKNGDSNYFQEINLNRMKIVAHDGQNTRILETELEDLIKRIDSAKLEEEERGFYKSRITGNVKSLPPPGRIRMQFFQHQRGDISEPEFDENLASFGQIMILSDNEKRKDYEQLYNGILEKLPKARREKVKKAVDKSIKPDHESSELNPDVMKEVWEFMEEEKNGR